MRIKDYRKGSSELLSQAAKGMQELLRLMEASVSTSQLGQLGLELGVVNVAGDYYFDVDCGGLDALEIHVRASSVSGTVTPSAYVTYADDTTSHTAMTDSGAGGLVAATRRTFSITGLKGQRTARLKLVVAGGASFTLDQCEANGL